MTQEVKVGTFESLADLDARLWDYVEEVPKKHEPLAIVDIIVNPQIMQLWGFDKLQHGFILVHKHTEFIKEWR